jgi:hypothetical protein
MPSFVPPLIARAVAWQTCRKVSAPVLPREIKRDRPMCRNIKTLFNFEPPATREEIHASALQFVRKLSGFNKPSQANAEAFNRAVSEVSDAAQRLLKSLQTNAAPRDREIEAEKARERSRARYATAG